MTEPVSAAADRAKAARVEVDERGYRHVLSHLPTGVTVVTGLTEDGPVGLSINSFTSVSLDPLLVGFLPVVGSRSWLAIEPTGYFCVNILAAGQADLAQVFATPVADRFAGVSWRPAPWSGSPVLDGAVAWLECALESVTPTGDHLFVLGRVRALEAHPGRDPLVFLRGRYLRVPD